MELAVDQVNQMNLDITITVILSILILVTVMTVVAVVQQKELKCPKCGNWRHNKASGVQTVSKVADNKTTLTTQRVIICRRCKNEFTV